MHKTLWENRFTKEVLKHVVRKTLLKRRCEKINFKKDVVRKTLWDRRCEKDVVRKMWERCDKINSKKDVVRKTLWEKHCRLRRDERCCVNYIVKKTMWERHCEKDVVRKMLWERRYEEDVVRKTLRERRRLSVMVRLLQILYWYISLGNVEFGPLLNLLFHIRYFVYAN